MQENQVIQTDNFNLTSVTSGSVKAAMKEAGATSRDLWYVPVNEIVQLEDFNVRVKNAEYFDAVRTIADSIKENGFYPHKPIACMVIKQNGKDVLAVIDGHTRYDAAVLAISEGAPLEKLPVVTTQSGVTMEDAIAGLVTNNSGKPLTPMAMGLVCKRLVSFGWSNSKVAAKIAVSIAYVGQLLQLVSADKVIRDLVNDDKISATLAVQTMNAEGEKAGEVLTQAVKTAKAQGKGKATAKHLTGSNAPSKPSKKGTLTEWNDPSNWKPSKKHETPVMQEQKDNSPVLPLMPSASVTPFDALVITEAVYKAETRMQDQGIDWLKQNVGIVDHSHYELIIAMTGIDLETLKGMLK
jgi:ParB-like chromosome segregation protein Spo0J